MRSICFGLATLYALASATPTWADDPSNELKWMRDSVEYWTLTRQNYRVALHAVVAQSATLDKRTPWTVVLDIDETVLDNSTYQLERKAYGDDFNWASWNGWCERRVAKPIPGATEFIESIRKMGAQIAFISNRHDVTRQATIDNLNMYGLWNKKDVLCLKTDDKAYDKVARRTELRKGEGACTLGGRPVTILAYLGDTIHDFPEEGEEVIKGDRDSQFGTRYVVFPNPMYGSWSEEITRPTTTEAP